MIKIIFNKSVNNNIIMQLSKKINLHLVAFLFFHKCHFKIDHETKNITHMKQYNEVGINCLYKKCKKSINSTYLATSKLILT